MTKKNVERIREFVRTARTNERRAARLLSRARRGAADGVKYEYAYLYAAKAQKCRNKLRKFEITLSYT